MVCIFTRTVYVKICCGCALTGMQKKHQVFIFALMFLLQPLTLLLWPSVSKTDFMHLSYCYSESAKCNSAVIGQLSKYIRVF